MHYTGKYCDVSLYTDTHEAIKSVSSVQAVTEYNNSDTRYTTQLSLMNQYVLAKKWNTPW